MAEITGSVFGVESAVSHSASFFNGGGAMALFKATAHGLTQGAISQSRGGSFREGFYGGFSSSGLSVGTKGYGGFAGRTMIMAVVGGTASQLGGGKFANGAVSGAFVHMFNAEWEDKQAKGTPKNNVAQNKQFRSATQGLSQDQKRTVHDMISGENYSYHEIKDLVRTLFAGKTCIIMPLTPKQVQDYQMCGINGCEL